MSSTSSRLIILPTDQSDVVRTPQGTGQGVATFTTDWEGQRSVTAVRWVEDGRMPNDAIAVGEKLAQTVELDRGDAAWELTEVIPVNLARLVLEGPTEEASTRTAAVLHAEPLVNRLLWLQPGQDWYVTVAGVPYRVHQIEPALSGPAVITRDTVLELFSPQVRTGVDLVILADCSGSMGVDDLPVGEGTGSRGGGFMTRAAALRHALDDLLEMRLRTSGRVSRVALVQFTEETTVRFPRDGGMVELDGDSPADRIAEFRSAIGLLLPKNGASTNIGNALVDAADLLHRSGHPGNEKAIVLVSDGAHWVAKDAQATGELVVAAQEPVSLMEHLNRDGELRLHAIGISNAQLYQDWVRRGGHSAQSLEPNHQLLRALEEVGGGDPATIGGLDVLVDYFLGLGAGVTTRVQKSDTTVSVPPLDAESERLLGRARQGADVADWPGALRVLLEHAGNFNGLARQRVRTFVLDALFASRLRPLLQGSPHDDAAAQGLLSTLLGSLHLRPEVAKQPKMQAYGRLVSELEAAVNGGLNRRELVRLTGTTHDDPGTLAVAVVRCLTAAVQQLQADLDIPHGDDVAEPTDADLADTQTETGALSYIYLD